MVSHAGCGQEHEVRSGVECAGGGGGGGLPHFLCSLELTRVCAALTSGKDVIHPEEGGTTACLGEETERPNNAGCADEGL